MADTQSAPPATSAVPSAPPKDAPRRSRLVPSSTTLRRAAVIAGFFVVWEIASTVVDNRLLPGPWAVVVELVRLVLDGQIWFHGQLTFQRGLMGLLLAIVGGLAFGVAMGRSRLFEAIFQPILAATYPIPKLALYPLMILTLGFGGASKVAMVALECFYPIAYNTYGGVQNIDKKYFWLGMNVQAGRIARLGIMLRAALPSIMASMRMAVPIMLTIMVVTELIGESRGLGFLLRQAGTNFQPVTALAIILVLAILGFLLDRFVVFLTNRLTFWAKGVEL